MKVRKKGQNLTLKKSRRKLSNKGNRRRISKKGQKRFCKKQNIKPLGIKMNKIKSKVNNGTIEEKTIKLVKKLLGDETIDVIPGIENDANLLQDLDLLVLGSSQEEYKRYRDLLRKEYSHLDDNSYKQMRLKLSDADPSTSRHALALNGAISVSSTKECLPSKKTFKKFRDNRRKNLQTSTYLPITSAPSPSQLVSRKILRTIRKRRIPLGLHKPNKSLTMNGSDEIHKDFRSCTPEPVSVETNILSDGIDDDCVCIEPQPEVILIEDETLTSSRKVKKMEADSCGHANLKPYEPIGSMRSNVPCSLNAITSTPKMRLLGGNIFYGDTIPSLDMMSSSISMIGDCTLVEKTNVDTEVVVIDDTVIQSENLVTDHKKRRHDTDDSVVFISEKVNTSSCQPSIAPAFIPLETPVEESHFRVKWSKSTPISKTTPKAKRVRNDLFNSKEHNQLRQYNENAYNPNGDDPALHTKKRMVIVDGSNVAYQHALNKEFSVKGLKICLDYFEKMGHDVKAVVPQFRLKKQRSTDSSGLEKLHQDGKIVFTPCKNLPGKSSISYDDRFVLQLAAELDAAIVSNDNYRDLIHENPAFKKIIENRVIGYTWCNDLFILPKDPYGKWGPTLSTILNRS